MSKAKANIDSQTLASARYNLKTWHIPGEISLLAAANFIGKMYRRLQDRTGNDSFDPFETDS